MSSTNKKIFLKNILFYLVIFLFCFIFSGANLEYTFITFFILFAVINYESVIDKIKKGTKIKNAIEEDKKELQQLVIGALEEERDIQEKEKTPKPL